MAGVVRFAEGVRGTIHMDVFSRQPFRLLEFAGEAGNLRCDLNANEITIVTPGADPVVEHFTNDRNDMFVDEARCFLDVLAGRSAPTVSGRDALATLRLAAAGIESNRTGSRITL